MPKSIVVYGPQGSGKNFHADAIAKRLGLQYVKDLDDVQLDGERLQRTGFLYLANSRDYGQRAASLLGTPLMPIADALALIRVSNAPANTAAGVARA